MSALERQVRRAQWRINLNGLMEWAALTMLAGAGLWGVLLLVERVLGAHVPVWHVLWVVAVLAGTAAIVGAWLRRVQQLKAATVVDAAAGLKERLSSALAIQAASDPFSQLVVADAQRAAGGLHVPTLVPLRAPRLWPWTTATIVTVSLLGWLMPSLNLLARGDDRTAGAPRQEVLAEQRAIEEDLSTQLDRIKELAQSNPQLQDLAKELEPIEMPDDPTVTPEDIRREAAQKIDNVADKLAAQKESVERDELKETERLMSKLTPQSGQDAAAELSQSLAQGDFKGAREALTKMQQELQEAAKASDAQAQQKVAQLQEQLKKLADELAALDDSTYLRKELQNKAGMSEQEAKELLEKLAQMDPKQLEKELQRQLAQKGMSQEQMKELSKKIQQKQQAQQACKNLGQCMSQACQALQQAASTGGNPAAAQAASAALGDAGDQLSQMEMSEQMMNELEAQLSELRNMRNSVCQGQYGEGGQCRGGNEQVGPQGPNYGRGIGSTVPKERAAHALQMERVKSRPQGGTIIGQMLVDGPQARGQATAEVREAVNSAQRDAQDAIERDEVPRQYHGAIQEYFERLAGLMRAGGQPTTQP